MAIFVPLDFWCWWRYNCRVMKDKRIPIMVEADLYEWLVREAARVSQEEVRPVSMAEVIRRCLREAKAKREKKAT